MARSIPQLSVRRRPLALAACLTAACGPAAPPLPPGPLARARADVLELAPQAWGDAAPGAATRATLRVDPDAPAWLRFRLPAGEAPARAYLRVYPEGLDAPVHARMAVARIEPRLAQRPRPPPPPRPSAVARLAHPMRLALGDAVRSAHAEGGELVLELRALDGPLRLSSPRATDPRRQPRLELWWKREVRRLRR